MAGTAGGAAIGGSAGRAAIGRTAGETMGRTCASRTTWAFAVYSTGDDGWSGDPCVAFNGIGLDPASAATGTTGSRRRRPIDRRGSVIARMTINSTHRNGNDVRINVLGTVAAEPPVGPASQAVKAMFLPTPVAFVTGKFDPVS